MQGRASDSSLCDVTLRCAVATSTVRQTSGTCVDDAEAILVAVVTQRNDVRKEIPSFEGANLQVCYSRERRAYARLIVQGEGVQRVVREGRLRKPFVVRRTRDGRTLRRTDASKTVDARTRFLSAIVRLLETRDADLLTVDVIVRAAALSRTTFYRLFRDRDGALRAASDKLLADVLAGLPPLDEPLGEAEPERLREFVAGLLDELMLRARAWRDARWQRLVAADLERYIGRLHEARIVRCDAPGTIASGVIFVLDGMLADATRTSRESIAMNRRTIAADVAERLVFGASLRTQASGAFRTT